MPAQPVPKSLASPGLLAFIATAKYADALPLYRQCRQFQRIGVELSRTTLARWMVCVGELLVPLINVLRDELVERPYLLMDETTVQVLKEPGKTPQSKSQLWALTARGSVQGCVAGVRLAYRVGVSSRPTAAPARRMHRSVG